MHRDTKKNASHYTEIKKLDTTAPKFYPPLYLVSAVLPTPNSGTAHRLCLKYFASYHALGLGLWVTSSAFPALLLCTRSVKGRVG